MTGLQQPARYIDQLAGELDEIEHDYLRLLESSEIVGTNLPSNFIGFAHWEWRPSSETQQADRMALLSRLRVFRPRFELLFPHPTPEIAERHTEALDHLERWLRRDTGDHSVPLSIARAVDALTSSIEVLRKAKDLLPKETFAIHAVVDTNVLLDDPDLARFTAELGQRYLVHLLPVVLRELDDHKRAGRNQDLREAARRADRRLKGLRDNGDVSVGAKVAGEVWVVFDHLEPHADRLPSWLDLSVADDRLVASALLLISRHPGAQTVVATGDLNLQTKLAAVKIPYLDPE